MSALHYKMGQAAVGAVTLGMVAVAGVVFKELGNKANRASAAEEYLEDELWAIETAECDATMQRRKQALIDDGYDLDHLREELDSRRMAQHDDSAGDEWAELLSHLVSSVIGNGGRHLGLTQ